MAWVLWSHRLVQTSACECERYQQGRRCNQDAAGGDSAGFRVALHPLSQGAVQQCAPWAPPPSTFRKEEGLGHCSPLPAPCPLPQSNHHLSFDPEVTTQSHGGCFLGRHMQVSQEDLEPQNLGWDSREEGQHSWRW